MGLFNWLSKSGDTGSSDRGEYQLVDRNLAEQQSHLVDAQNFHTGSADDREYPTEEDRKVLRKVADKLPWSAFLVAVVELCERFTYYGLSGPFQNYIENSYHDVNGLPGAIGLGQTGATALTNFFQFWCYVTPTIGAIVADQYLGKFWTIFYFSIVYIAGILILFLTSLPAAIEHGFAFGGLIVAMIVIGLGTGGIKSNVSPLIAEQYQNTKQYIKILNTGERVIVDPAVTIQRIYMIFYMCINIGSLSAVATTTMEANTGFWSAYLLCLIAFFVGFGCLILGKKKYVLRPPKGSVIPHAFKVCLIGLRQRSLDAAKPEYIQKTTRHLEFVPWDNLFVEEVRRALTACKVFLFYPIYWCVYSQMLNNFISQAGKMQLHGIPNDIMQNIDPITIIIFIPICDRLLYPALRKIGIEFKPITRIFWGFLLASGAMAYAAFVQKIIYDSEPCYEAPGACEAALKSDGSYAPNNVHVAVQTPAYLLIGLSEIFASITGLEYAFTKAPPNLKSFIMSLFLLMSAFGSIFGAALSPTAVDPTLLWMYIGLAVTCLVTGGAFWLLFHKLNDTEESMNELEQHGDKPSPIDHLQDSVDQDDLGNKA